MTYTISYIPTSNRYGVHIGVGTMYNMTRDFGSYEQAFDEACALAKIYKSAMNAKEVKVILDNGFMKPSTLLATF